VRAEVRPVVAPGDDDVRGDVETGDGERDAVGGCAVDGVADVAFVVVELLERPRLPGAGLLVGRRDDGDVVVRAQAVVERADAGGVDAVVVGQEDGQWVAHGRRCVSATVCVPEAGPGREAVALSFEGRLYCGVASPSAMLEAWFLDVAGTDQSCRRWSQGSSSPA